VLAGELVQIGLYSLSFVAIVRSIDFEIFDLDTAAQTCLCTSFFLPAHNHIRYQGKRVSD
jgi:hypothetical protein